MGLTPDGWFDWAERKPGPVDKVYSTPCTNQGVIPHSQVGYQPGAEARLFSTQREPSDPTRYTAYASASWTGSILYSGVLRQHYPIDKACWASGARYLNINFNAFEMEGGPADNPSEPLTDAQVDTLVRVIRELSEYGGWVPVRPQGPSDLSATLYEHRENTRWGGLPTACPSGRIPWVLILARLEDDMSTEDKENIGRLLLVVADHGILDDQGNIVSGKNVEALEANGSSLMLLNQLMLKALKEAGSIRMRKKLQELGL